MKHTTKLFLSSLLCVVLHTVAGAQVPGNVLPAVERAATQAAQRAAAQTARIAVPQVTNAAAQTNLLTLFNADMALQSATQHVELWKNSNLLPKGQSPTLAAAIRAQEILHTAFESKEGKPYEAKLSAVEEYMDIYPIDGYQAAKHYDMLAQALYPSEAAKGLLSSGEDLMEFMTEKSNKYYLYMMFTHAPAIRRVISENLTKIRREIRAQKSFDPEKPLVWAIEQIPADTDKVVTS